MVRHILFWNLTDSVKAAHKEAEVMEAMKASCRRMKEGIPQLKTCEILEAKTPGSTHDFMFYCELENMEDIPVFVNHPLHLAHKEMARDWVTDRAMVDGEELN